MLDPQLIYVAIYGRPADPLGLAYWNDATKGGADLSPLVGLTGTPEYLDRFDGMRPDEIVNSIFRSLFNRNADIEGLGFFSNLLDTGAQSIDTIALHIAGAAQGADADVLNAKVTIADAFTAALDADAEVAAYAGSEAASLGAAVINPADPVALLNDGFLDQWVTNYVGVLLDGPSVAN